MDIKEKFGQMIMLGLDVDTINDEIISSDYCILVPGKKKRILFDYDMESFLTKLRKKEILWEGERIYYGKIKS